MRKFRGNSTKLAVLNHKIELFFVNVNVSFDNLAKTKKDNVFQ